ncbi:MAG: class I SAM-dependent methyltransferase [Lawsonibacter sp.]|nr:class I SAM-dependent methyltransferase [Lawsonibacter sp.]
MDGQPERCYAVEQLKTLQGSIADLTQGMVIRRARVEKYKDTDLAAARDTFAELQGIRKQLAQAIGDARLLLMEAEEYQTAKTAAMLQAGLLRFNLMSNAYRPVYDAIQNFIKEFPVEGTANAAVIGRLMNNVKLGYYPTDPDNISLILRGIQFPEGVTTNLFDPCCGCGKALRQLAQGNNCYAYGVELDESRGSEAQTRLHRVGFGSFFFSQVSHEAFHLLFLNPPYLSVLNESGGRARHEKRFLIESLCHLMYGGLLVYVIPYYRLTPDICRVLVDNFEGLTVWRFTDSEFKKFKQIAVMGLRKRRADVPEDTLWLEKYTVDPTTIPSLTDIPENQYPLPAQPLEVKTFKGERFNEKDLEQQLRSCDSFAQFMARSELDKGVKRPLLPLSISQIGLIGGSGMINGLIQCDNPHIIKGRIIKVTRTECEDRYASNGNHIGSEIRETISNKMIFNVLTPHGFRALT